MNTAIAAAEDAEKMAQAMKLAVQAGRLAFESGRKGKKGTQGIKGKTGIPRSRSGHKRSRVPFIPFFPYIPFVPCLMNTAIAAAEDAEKMAQAMKLAVQAGRLAFESGRMAKKLYASASSPLAGVVR